VTRPTSAIRRLILVRHGRPDYRGNKSGDWWPGPPLSEIGHRQAQQAARIVRVFAPAAIYASPLTRAWDTARHLARPLRLTVQRNSELAEWQRTEQLHDVTVRVTRWLVSWLRHGEPCAVAVSHASPILAILRSALYLPHYGWHIPGRPDVLQISSGDRFEISMGSVFELVMGPHDVIARRLFHPTPRILAVTNHVPQTCLPRTVAGQGENEEVRRPNYLHLLGARASRS